MSGGPLISGAGPGPDWKGPEGPWLLGPDPINGGGGWVPAGCIGTTGSTGLCKIPYDIKKNNLVQIGCLSSAKDHVNFGGAGMVL